MTAVDTDLSASSTPSAIAVSPEVERFVADTAQVATEGFALFAPPGCSRPAPRSRSRSACPATTGSSASTTPTRGAAARRRSSAAVFGFDRTPVLGDPAAARGARRFAAIFEQHPDVTTVVHMHSPYLGALGAGAPRAARSSTGCWRRPRPSPELPVYIDRRQAEVDFILDQIARDPAVPAIVEANGGGDGLGPRRPGRRRRVIHVIEQAAAHA